MKKKLTKSEEIKKEKEYVEFLRKRLNSDNYKKNISAEEYEKTKVKFDKAKFSLKILETTNGK